MNRSIAVWLKGQPEGGSDPDPPRRPRVAGRRSPARSSTVNRHAVTVQPIVEWWRARSLSLDGWSACTLSRPGRRQAWPFLQFADPSTGREVRIDVDGDLEVRPGYLELNQDEDRVLTALDTLMGATVTQADADGARLRVLFGSQSLVVAAGGNHLTTHAMVVGFGGLGRSLRCFGRAAIHRVLAGEQPLGQEVPYDRRLISGLIGGAQ